MKVGPNPMTGALKEETVDTQTHRGEGDEGRG